MYSETEESETSELLMGVLRELKDIKQMLVNNTQQLNDLQTHVDAISSNYHSSDYGYEDVNFPITTFEDLEEVEEMMKDDDGREYLIMQMKYLLKADDTRWPSKLINDEMMQEFNLTGQSGKRNLLHLEIMKFALKYLKVDKTNLAFYVRRTKDRLSHRLRHRLKRKLDGTSVTAKSEEIEAEEKPNDATDNALQD